MLHFHSLSSIMKVLICLTYIDSYLPLTNYYTSLFVMVTLVCTTHSAVLRISLCRPMKIIIHKPHLVVMQIRWWSQNIIAKKITGCESATNSSNGQWPSIGQSTNRLLNQNDILSKLTLCYRSKARYYTYPITCAKKWISCYEPMKIFVNKLHLVIMPMT